MTTGRPRYGTDEHARRGDAIYERDVRPRVEPGDAGKYVAIDIETGAYEVDANELAASDRLLARVPDAQTWLRRVGSRYARRIGPRPPAGRPMSTGTVTAAREAIVPLVVRGPSGQEEPSRR